MIFEQEQPLLVQGVAEFQDHEPASSLRESKLPDHKNPPSGATRGLVAFLVIYSLITTALCVWTLQRGQKTNVQTPYSPTEHVLDYEKVELVGDPESVFLSEPSERLNEAWRKLLTPMYISASREELELSDDNPPERLQLLGEGYLAALGVYHELHCLRRVYWNYYRETYFPNQTTEERAHERGHAVHCLETIRRSLMCSANLALYSFEWRHEGGKPKLRTGAKRKCVKWTPLHAWASERALGLNPTFRRPDYSAVGGT